MYDSPVANVGLEYGSIDNLPEDVQAFFQKCHDKLTLEQLRSCREFFQSKIDALNRACEENCTIQDFEDAKKEDIDNDGEEGES